VDTASARAFVLFLVNLNNANHGLTINFWIIIDDYVEPAVNRDDAGGSKGLHVVQLSLSQLDVVTSGDGFLLLEALSVLFECNLMDVGEVALTSSLFDR